jgi:uncharacterized membrane protein
MSKPSDTLLASAINLSQPGATILLSASDLAAILGEVRYQRDLIKLLQERQDRDYERFTGDICDHGQRLKALEVTKLQPLQKDRGEILRALLAANGGKMLAKDARKQMGVSKTIFSRLLVRMKDCIDLISADVPPTTQSSRQVLSPL